MNENPNYAEAEKLAGERGDWYFANPEDVPTVLARAQVHATLALVDQLRALTELLTPAQVESVDLVQDYADRLADAGKAVTR